MKRIQKLIAKALAHKGFFIIADIIAINLSSFLALWIRFNLSFDLPEVYIQSLLGMALINTVATIAIFALFRLYNVAWRFAGELEFMSIALACVTAVTLNLAIFFFLEIPIFRSYFIIYGVELLIFTSLIRYAFRMARIIYRKNLSLYSSKKNVLIIGGGEACSLLMKELQLSRKLDIKVKSVIDDNPNKKGTYIHGIKIVGGREKIGDTVARFNINEIIIAMPSAPKKEVQKIVELCKDYAPDCELKILPGVYQIVKGDVSINKIRNVEIEDLLGRDVVNINSENVKKYVSGKVVLVTGAGGSIGSELCRQIAANGVKKLVMFDIYENGIYDLQQELKKRNLKLDLVALVGSVRDENKLEVIFNKYKPDIVFHAAAHKHVPLMEDSPNEAIKNNVFGTYKVAYMADRYRVEKFVLISTDKAVNPTNIMGATKRLCEMVVQLFSNFSSTEYCAVRFGNVLGSNGSVVPLFKKQIEAGGPVTVTHPDIIRYFMTIPEAVSLVLEAGTTAKGGEIFVLDMGEPVKIVDLAKNLIKLSGHIEGEDIEIQYTGLRPGEKLFEELLMSEEGLENTENKLIFIGKPIEFDEKELLKKLIELYSEINNETDDAKELIKNIVNTYKPSDIEVDTKNEHLERKGFAKNIFEIENQN